MTNAASAPTGGASVVGSYKAPRAVLLQPVVSV